ncbi:hypothetical protein [Sphingomonas solaris]|uniref:Uncharacterized protein n=1 Tax=Alterirhizorhabdus solaris TaxID=2529389 RepID=A0A558RC46_9SPHN|nr:hypothetical protein [Sphingomonas solaris]TVV76923.1 hypothetical protein FOY91_02425 [Sphingomonas solaris]
MSGFDFDKSGTFGSEKAAGDYAKRNNLSVQDYQIRQAGDGVELEVRRSAVNGDKLHDTGEGRKEGFF